MDSFSSEGMDSRDVFRTLPISHYGDTLFQRFRSRIPSRKQFTLLDYTVYLSPNEIFEPFVELASDLSMENVYSKYINSTA